MDVRYPENKSRKFIPIGYQWHISGNMYVKVLTWSKIRKSRICNFV